MFKNSLLCIRRGVLRVGLVVVILAFGFFGAKPASANTVGALVSAGSDAFQYNGGAMATLTAISSSEEELVLSEPTFCLGGGEMESLDGDVDLFANGTASGSVEIDVSWGESPYGPLSAVEGVSFSTWTFPTNNPTLELAGNSVFLDCEPQCDTLAGPGYMDVIGFATVFTPEPSSLLLLGTGLLGLFPAIRRLET